MKNRGTKILILALSITVAIAGILVFWITVVAPPTEVPMRNTHKALLAENINNFKANFSVGDAAANEKFYDLVTDKLKLYKEEYYTTNTDKKHLFTSEDLDSLTTAFLNAYVPVYSSSCNAKFSRAWTDNDLKAMQKRIAELRAFRVNNGTQRALSDELNSSLYTFDKWANLYYTASKVAKSTSFKNASNTINEANRYAGTFPLRHCKALVAKLKAVPKNIESAHYKHVQSKVDAAGNYYDVSDFGTWQRKYLEAAQSAIDEYNNRRSTYGSAARSTSSLQSQLENYKSWAYNWFYNYY